VNRLQGQTIAVIGGHGFIGSHLVEALVDEGADVRVLCAQLADGSLGCLEYVDPVARRGLDLRIGDAMDSGLVCDLIDGANAVYYTYAQYPCARNDDTPLGKDYHTSAVVALVAAMEQQRVGVAVFTSTGDHGRPPVWASAQRPDAGPSLASILSAERVLATFLNRGLPISRLAPCMVYGPRQPVDALIPTVLRQLRAWIDPVTVPGPVPQQEFLYIDDLVEALIVAADAQHASYELRTGSSLSINDVFQACCNIMDAQGGIKYTPMPLGPPLDAIDHALASIARRQQLPNWTPRVSLDEGLRRTTSWLFPYPYRSTGVSWSA
jgi:UDP-glucose 4-epimerase